VLCQHLTVHRFAKKDFLLDAGNVCKKRFFLLEGLVRTFYIDSDGNERITLFGKELWWVTALESYVGETPSKVNIQAIEDTTALVLSKESLELLYQEVPKLERFFRIITEKWLIAEQRSSQFYMKASSKERYETMVKFIPRFVQRVPQYMIASYLDISPEHLSTLRKYARDSHS